MVQYMKYIKVPFLTGHDSKTERPPSKPVCSRTVIRPTTIYLTKHHTGIDL